MREAPQGVVSMCKTYGLIVKVGMPFLLKIDLIIFFKTNELQKTRNIRQPMAR